MEAPARVVDLRNQIRTTSINAVTRDGIEVRVPVSSLFRIDRGFKKVMLGEPWPYRNKRSIFHAVFGAEVDPSGRSPLDARASHPWEGRTLITASHKAKQVVAFYSLDQLYSVPGPGLLPIHQDVQSALGLRPAQSFSDPLLRSTAGKLVRQAVRQAFEPEGFEILGGSFGNKVAPVQRDVTDQRVVRWKSALVTKVMDWQTKLQEKRLREFNVRRQRARGLAAEQVITYTSNRLTHFAPATQLAVRAYEVLYALISVAQNPEVRKMLPDSALPTLEMLMQQTAGEQLEGGAT